MATHRGDLVSELLQRRSFLVGKPGDAHRRRLARLKIHAGGPVQGACRHQRFLYTRGDIDILPAGVSGVWQGDDSNTSLIVQLSPSLLRRTAEELGADPDDAGRGASRSRSFGALRSTSRSTSIRICR
jgi:hypothetical protein